MARAVLFKGQSNYGALRVHIDQLAEGFKEIGHEAVIIDLLAYNATNLLNQTIQKPCDFFLGFNAMGCDIGNEQQLLYDAMNVPFIGALVDHPNCHTQRLDTKLKHYFVTCLDQSHIKFLDSHYDQDHFAFKSFLVPGGNTSSNYHVEKDYDEFLSKRTIPILFTGSFHGEPKRGWIDYPKSVKKLLDEVAEYTLAHDLMPLEDSLNYILTSNNIGINTKIKQNLDLLMHLVQHYVHHTRRYNFVKTLGEAQVPIVVYGQGWEPWVEKWTSFSLCEEGKVEDSLDNLHKAKICLNTNTHFVNGGHERVFNAMINGAVVFTDESKYYNEVFVNDEEIVTYTWSKLEDAPNKLFSLIEDPEKIFKISQAAKQKVDREHSWKNRAEQILEMVELYRTLINVKQSR